MFWISPISMNQLVNGGCEDALHVWRKCSIPMVIRAPSGSALAPPRSIRKPGSLVCGMCRGSRWWRLPARTMPRDCLPLPFEITTRFFSWSTSCSIGSGTRAGRIVLHSLQSAEIKREGRDLTIVAYSIMVRAHWKPAEKLAAEGIEVEVVDPRCLKPSTRYIIRSVSKTGRVLIAHEAPLTGGFGGELAAVIAGSEAFDYLDAPIRRLAGLNVPIPYNRTLERAACPG